MNRSFLVWMGALGSLAFPLFYLLRFTGQLPPRYDDLALRAIATLLCLALALRPWWPERARPFYLAHAYFTSVYCLAFLLTFTTLKNQGDSFSFVNMVIGAVCVILVADWRNAVVMLVAGYALGALAFWASQPGIAFTPDVWIWLPAPTLLFVAGALSHFERRQAELARHRLYMSFAGSIAHEMRGPMQKIQGVFDTLERDFLRLGPSQSSVSHTREQVMAMVRVMNEGRNAIKLGLQSITVTLQQLKSRAFDASGFTWLSAAVCTERAVSDFGYESEAQRERVRLAEVADFTFKGDETLLTLILFNLIKNALYYLPACPDVMVTVTVDAQCITVRDTGPGIAPEKMEHLFEDFQTSGKADGTGLGLAFCRRAMRAFGGEITCASRLGEFTAFTLSFPAVAQAEARAHAEEAMRHAARLLRGARVLLVDDDPIRRRASLAQLLALVGSSSIDEAGNGAQALDLLRLASDVPYDLVVMDLHMPVLDGCDTVRQIRLGAAAGHEQVPVLAHSVQPATEARAQAREAGMDGFLSAPCSLPEMAGAIVSLLKDQPLRHSAKDPAPFMGSSVLLAEDNAVNRAIVKGYLKDMGLEVVEAQQGQDVLQFLKAGVRPAVILMDVEMPVLGGMETTRQLRAMADGVRKIPVVALTGHASPEHRQAARDAGMDGFLTKPVNVVALRGELARLIGERPVGEAQAAGASPSPARLAGATIDGPLLDDERVEQLKSMNIMVNLLPDGLAQARRHIANLEDAVRRNDLKSARQALHSLAGLSGEMGAHAMSETAKQHSRVVESNAWPFEPNWLARFNTLFLESEQALLTSFALRKTSPS
jgi:two-component system CAI-1 autoinducer sensor kinase/phosphatase CqsS